MGDRIVQRVSYEWDYESVDEYGDILDHDFRDECPGLPTESNVELVLVRNVFTGLSGDDFNMSADLEHRSWAYVVNGQLPEEFDDGERVPKKLHADFAKAIKIQQAQGENA
jgi:hypothetical protein